MCSVQYHATSSSADGRTLRLSHLKSYNAPNYLRMKMKLKKGDHVVVVSGKDKGKTGIIYRALPAENKVVIEGIALKKRHVKGRAGAVGQIVESPHAINASNVMFMDPESKKGTRVGRKTADDGKKVRVAKKSGKTLA